MIESRREQILVFTECKCKDNSNNIILRYLVSLEVRLFWMPSEVIGLGGNGLDSTNRLATVR